MKASKYLILDTRINGERRRIQLSKDEVVRTFLNKGSDTQTGPKGAITLKEFGKCYFDLHITKKRSTTQKRLLVGLKNLCAKLGDLNLHEITIFIAEQYRNARQKEKNPTTKKDIRPATINRETTQLKHMTKMAVRWGYLLSNPLTDFEKLPEMNERSRWLKKDEIEKFLGVLSGWMKDFVEVAINTGLRLGELRNLRWVNVKFEEGYICAETEKQQNQPLIRYIHLRSRLRQILLKMHANVTDNSGWVFPSSTGKPRREALVEVNFRRAVMKAGFEEHTTFHDLRRTFAMHHAIAHKDPYMLRNELGHSDFRTLHRYVSVSHVYDKRFSIFENDIENPSGEKVATKVAS